MKNHILAVAAFTCIASASFAQSSTPTQADTIQSQTPYENKTNHLIQKDMVLVNNSDVPDQLKQTLKNEKYKGWESGRIFKSPNGDMYMLELETKGKTLSTFKFDKDGTPIRK